MFCEGKDALRLRFKSQLSYFGPNNLNKIVINSCFIKQSGQNTNSQRESHSGAVVKHMFCEGKDALRLRFKSHLSIFGPSNLNKIVINSCFIKQSGQNTNSQRESHSGAVVKHMFCEGKDALRLRFKSHLSIFGPNNLNKIVINSCFIKQSGQNTNSQRESHSGAVVKHMFCEGKDALRLRFKSHLSIFGPSNLNKIVINSCFIKQSGQNTNSQSESRSGSVVKHMFCEGKDALRLRFKSHLSIFGPSNLNKIVINSCFIKQSGQNTKSQRESHSGAVVKHMFCEGKDALRLRFKSHLSIFGPHNLNKIVINSCYIKQSGQNTSSQSENHSGAVVKYMFCEGKGALKLRFKSQLSYWVQISL
ncbi:uncharacterized protein LOC120476629 isoform X3 [Pimephales promelas]|uniref:uncharacterized protein LOC120476629 isoform X1 n=1 Tax=Pimephales promelas TaxID=90988 RepID=UPI001955EC5D|nr:uncharacterized protein LOC120476629 isoform X1 [Pimephales promelas]XP_039523714.1 uncharacterized protein LOC120476629 isoform X2 [Pimephales promelas]XP_039523716.1 uncharacterized protein LOC120476629 isoform X3 [Pimephales promelas]